MNFLKREGITLRQYFWMIWIDLDPDPGCFHGHVTLSDFQLRSLLADLFECDFSNSCAAVDKISTVKCLCPKIAMTQSWVKRTSMHSQSAKLLRTQLRSVTDGASRRVIGWHYTSVTLVSWSQISSEFFIFQHDSPGAQGAWQSTFPDNFSKCWAILKFFQNRPRVVK